MKEEDKKHYDIYSELLDLKFQAALGNTRSLAGFNNAYRMLMENAKKRSDMLDRLQDGDSFLALNKK